VHSLFKDLKLIIILNRLPLKSNFDIMENITLTIKDRKKKKFFLQLINQLDFIEINKKKSSTSEKYDFFQSAGMLKTRNISAAKLREDAWKRNQ
jgi:hypothetical protein